MYLKKPKH